MPLPLRRGPFELQDAVALGGMAEVWRGRHLPSGAPVAVKVIRGERALDPTYREFFRREAQAAATLLHPAIVPVYDYGAIPEAVAEATAGRLPAGSPYLVMQWADGGTLDDHRPTSFAEVRRILLAVLDALAYAHAHGIVHRDLKPANLLCRRRDGDLHVALSDFGIAHATMRTRGELQRPSLAGTPQYMPPEQLRGAWRDFGPWTDLYALGCVAWELTCGSPPFDGGNVAELAHRHLVAPVPEPAFQLPVPDAMVPWLERLLAKDPGDRFRCAADAARALVRMPDPGGTVARVGPMEHAATTVLDATLRSVPVGEAPPAGERPRPTAEDPPPPVPDTWRRPAGDPDGEPLHGAGLGLWGLREIPVVDRDAERDAIWQAFREACERRDLRTVWLEGRPGFGKTHLAEWMARRIDELGLAAVFRASHGSGDGSSEGIAGMLESALALWDLRGEPAVEHVHRWLVRRAGTGVPLAEARAVVSLVAPDVMGDDVIGMGCRSRAERHALALRVLRRLAGERPMCLVLDDLHRSPETAAFLRLPARPRRAGPDRRARDGRAPRGSAHLADAPRAGPESTPAAV